MGGVYVDAMILHTYSQERAMQQRETWKALDSMRKTRMIFDRECIGIDGYDSVLSTFWGIGVDLIVVEQDIVPRIGMIKELENCGEPIAAQAYYLCTIERLPVIAHRKYTETMSTEWIEEGETKADLIGLGLSYFSKEAQRMVDIKSLSNNRRWDNLDLRLSQAFYNLGISFDIHYPLVVHNHA